MADNTDVPKVYERKWVERTSEPPVGPPHFSLMTYNILADKHIPKDKYQYCPPEIRYMEWRHKHILAEIDGYGCDILCLQEVSEDNFEQHMKPGLEARGFAGDMMNRRHGSGQATFYRRSVFDLLEVRKVAFVDIIKDYIKDLSLQDAENEGITKGMGMAGDCVVLTSLKHKASGKTLYVGNIHVLWGDLKYPGVQVVEVVLASKELYKFAGGTDKPAILCGDFNSPTYWPPYDILQTGKLNESSMDTLRKEPPLPFEGCERTVTECLNEIFNIPFDFRSSYLTVQGREPAITNSDDGAQDYTTKLCLDYIWFNNGTLDVTGVLETPPEDDISKYVALPSQLFPSDHIPLKADLKFL